jgi:hypothetical protein
VCVCDLVGLRACYLCQQVIRTRVLNIDGAGLDRQSQGLHEPLACSLGIMDMDHFAPLGECSHLCNASQ